MRKISIAALALAVAAPTGAIAASDEPIFVFTPTYADASASQDSYAFPPSTASSTASATQDGAISLGAAIQPLGAAAAAEATGIITTPRFSWTDSTLRIEATVRVAYRFEDGTLVAIGDQLDAKQRASIRLGADTGGSFEIDAEPWTSGVSGRTPVRALSDTTVVSGGLVQTSARFQTRCGESASIQPVVTAAIGLSAPMWLGTSSVLSVGSSKVSLDAVVEEVRVYEDASIPCLAVHTIDVVGNGFDPMALTIPIHAGIDFDFSQAPAFAKVMIEGNGRSWNVHPIDREVFIFREPGSYSYIEWGATNAEGQLTIEA